MIISLGKANTANNPKLFSGESEGATGWNAEVCFSEDDLAMYAKRFIAKFLQQCILGWPSRVLGVVVIKYIAVLKGSATVEVKSKDGLVSLEEICKKVRSWVSFGQTASQNYNRGQKC